MLAQEYEGSHTDHSIAYYENPGELDAALHELYAHSHEMIDGETRVIRTPGSFILEFASGALSIDQIRNFLDQPDNVAVACMDERVESMDGKETITSHESCGAAGLVAGMAADNNRDNEAYRRLKAMLGDDLDVALDKVQAGSSTDEVGKLWSQFLAKDRGAEYKHLAVDNHEHYASAAFLDGAGLIKGNTPGEIGHRMYVISGTRDLGATTEKSYELLANYGVLAMKIAGGDHSETDKTKPFTMVVTIRNEQDKAAFEASFATAIGAANIASELYRVVYKTQAQLAA